MASTVLAFSSMVIGMADTSEAARVTASHWSSVSFPVRITPAGMPVSIDVIRWMICSCGSSAEMNTTPPPPWATGVVAQASAADRPRAVLPVPGRAPTMVMALVHRPPSNTASSPVTPVGTTAPMPARARSSRARKNAVTALAALASLSAPRRRSRSSSKPRVTRTKNWSTLSTGLLQSACTLAAKRAA